MRTNIHVNIGPVNDIIKSLKVRYPGIIKILEQLHIQRSKYHGCNFEGNQCKKIIKNIRKLKIPDNLSEYRDILYAIKDLHFVCNSEILPCSYPEVIDNFAKRWFKLKSKFHISTTPKLHIILDHLEDYFDETELSLKKTSDEGRVKNY